MVRQSVYATHCIMYFSFSHIDRYNPYLLCLAGPARLCLRDQIPVLRTQDLAGTAELVCTIVQESDAAAEGDTVSFASTSWVYEKVDTLVFGI